MVAGNGNTEDDLHLQQGCAYLGEKHNMTLMLPEVAVIQKLQEDLINSKVYSEVFRHPHTDEHAVIGGRRPCSLKTQDGGLGDESICNSKTIMLKNFQSQH